MQDDKSKFLPVGQFYVPTIDDFKDVIDQILTEEQDNNNCSREFT